MLVIDRVLQSARELTGARYAAVGVLDASRTELDRFITVGIDEDARREIGVLPRGRGVLGELIRDPVPLRLSRRRRASPLLRLSARASADALVPRRSDPCQRRAVREPLSDREGGRRPVHRRGSRSRSRRSRGSRVSRSITRVATRVRRRAATELARMVAALEATTEITHAVGGATDVDVILELVAKRGRALVSAQALLIEIVHGGELVVAAAAGDRPAGLIGERIALADTVASAALRTRTTHRLEVELNRARFDQHGLGRLGVSADGRPRRPADLSQPELRRSDRAWTGCTMDRRSPLEDQALLEGFATSAAISVATARSAASELQRQRLAAAEDERGRWARELHDETLQSLAGLRLSLSIARRKGGEAVLEGAVTEAIEQLEDGISNLRALVTDLRPAALDQLGLAAALAALCERASRHGLEIDSSIELAFEQGREPTRHTPELESAIYRIIQEALTNATKHGHATRAVIETRENATTVELSVRDDGDGFDPATSTAGFGLLGMRERVQLLHGTVQIGSSPGDGTTVTASFPAQRRPATAATATPDPVRRTGTGVVG